MNEKDERSLEDTKRIMDAALKRALKTPPKPFTPKAPKGKKPATKAR